MTHKEKKPGDDSTPLDRKPIKGLEARPSEEFEVVIDAIHALGAEVAKTPDEPQEKTLIGKLKTVFKFRPGK